MIEEIRQKIISNGRTDELYKQFIQSLVDFSINLAEKREKQHLQEANLEFEKSKYFIMNRENFKSDLACNNSFKILNAQEIHDLEVDTATNKMLQEKLKAYEIYADYLKSEQIKDLAISKHTK